MKFGDQIHFFTVADMTDRVVCSYPKCGKPSHTEQTDGRRRGTKQEDKKRINHVNNGQEMKITPDAINVER